MNDLQKLFSDFITSSGFSGKLTLDEKLSKHSTFKIGGTTEIFYEPVLFDHLIKTLAFCRSNNIKFYVIGGGSNIVFPDETFHGVTITTTGISAITKTQIDEHRMLVKCESGTTMAAFVQFCTDNELSGAEQFAGLPGTIGGALYMNARCFEKSISELFKSARYLDLDDFTLNEHGYMDQDWDYKVSPFQNSSKIIGNATFELSIEKGKKAQIADACKIFIGERGSKGHFKYPSAGSVFRNNHSFGAPCGKLIDECGLKGTTIGGAQIAPFHGNFIINTGNATAKDVKDLVNLAVNTVREKKGFSLVPEIIFL